jgi:predicted nucleic acid-binding protein
MFLKHFIPSLGLFGLAGLLFFHPFICTLIVVGGLFGVGLYRAIIVAERIQEELEQARQGVSRELIYAQSIKEQPYLKQKQEVNLLPRSKHQGELVPMELAVKKKSA